MKVFNIVFILLFLYLPTMVLAQDFNSKDYLFIINSIESKQSNTVYTFNMYKDTHQIKTTLEVIVNDTEFKAYIVDNKNNKSIINIDDNLFILITNLNKKRHDNSTRN